MGGSAAKHDTPSSTDPSSAPVKIIRSDHMVVQLNNGSFNLSLFNHTLKFYIFYTGRMIVNIHGFKFYGDDASELSRFEVYLKKNTSNKTCFDLDKMFSQRSGNGPIVSNLTSLDKSFDSDNISVIFGDINDTSGVYNYYDNHVYIEINQEELDNKFQCP